MRAFVVPPDVAKGWFTGPWDSQVPIALGYASQGIDEPHRHERLTEIYLVARGHSELRVGAETVELTSGSVVIVEPGEPHTFLSSSEDYLHFVIHVKPSESVSDKVIVERSSLTP